MSQHRVAAILVAAAIACGVLVEAQDPPAGASSNGVRVKALRSAADSDEMLDEVVLATDASGRTRLVMGGGLDRGRQRRWWLVDRRTGEYVVVRLTKNVMNDAKRIQNIYRRLGIEVSAERLAFDLLPESQRLQDDLRGLPGRVRGLANRPARALMDPSLPGVTSAVFVDNDRRNSPEARLTELLHRSDSEQCVPAKSSADLRQAPSRSSRDHTLRLVQNGYLECYGYIWADIQTWEPARYVFDVTHLNETFADAVYTRSYQGNITYLDPDGWCWANPSTFINTVWNVVDCIPSGPTWYGSYFDWAMVGFYVNADFIYYLTGGQSSGAVAIVATAAVTYSNGQPLWGYDYYETGDTTISAHIGSFFLSGIEDGDYDEDCEWICEPGPGVVEECETYHQGTWNWETCECTISPILIDVDGDGLSLTGSANGVVFDLLATGTPVRTGWTARGADDAFLALDRNGNGQIDDAAELFGTKTPQPIVDSRGKRKTGPNGFLALAVYDRRSRGGNEDGLITAEDAVYGDLRLWTDANHNGISEARELAPLSRHGIRAISLKYVPSKKVDPFGNALLLWSHVIFDGDLASPRRMQRRAVDVNFVFQMPASAPVVPSPGARVL